MTFANNTEDLDGDYEPRDEEYYEQMREKFNKKPKQSQNPNEYQNQESSEPSPPKRDKYRIQENNSGWEEIIDLYESGDNGTTSKANQKAAEKFVEEYHPKTVKGSSKSDNDIIYYYDEDMGCYINEGKYKFYEVMEENLGEKFTNNRKYEIIPKVRHKSYVDRDELDAPENMVCVDNGVLDLSNPSDPELLPHSPEYTFTWKLDTLYKEGVKNKQFLDFVQNTIQPGDIKKLQEYTGRALEHSKQPGKMTVLLGPRNAGKGTYLHAIESIFGGDNIASETVKALADDRWAGYSLINSRLNIANELGGGKIESADTIKTLTGEGDSTRVEQKGETPRREKPTSNHLFATNRLPEAPEADDVFFSRWLYVTFPETVPKEERIRDLDEKLVDSDDKKAGILNWIIGGLERRNEESVTEYSNELSVDEKEAQWRSFGSPIEQFIEICIDTETAINEDCRSKKDVYKTFCQMCEESGIPVESQKKLSIELGKLPGVNPTQRTEGSITEPYFAGNYQPRVFAGLEFTKQGEQYFNKAINCDMEAEPIDTQSKETF